MEGGDWKGKAFKGSVKGKEKSSDRVIIFEGDFAGDGLVKVEFGSLGMSIAKWKVVELTRSAQMPGSKKINKSTIIRRIRTRGLTSCLHRGKLRSRLVGLLLRIVRTRCFCLRRG